MNRRERMRIEMPFQGICGYLVPLSTRTKGRQRLEAHLALALPIDKETIFVDFEEAVQFDLCIVLLFRPAIKNTTVTKRFRHLDLPVEFELLRHLRGVPPTSGKVSLGYGVSRFCQ